MPITIRTAGFENFLDPSGGAYLKALIMGDHGVGKTPFAANWPDPIIADCEKGILSVASLGTPYAEIKTSADMQALLEMLRLEGMKPVEKRRFKTLVIDTVDTYQRKLIQERLKAERKEALSGWADWGYLDGKMVQLLEAVLNLPMNVVVNMHTKDAVEDDGESQTLVQKARLKGDVKDSIFQDFDLIGHMEQSYVAGTGDKKGERVRVRQIRWHSEPKYPALRDRSNKLPRFTDVTFEPSDYWNIFNAITEGLDDLPKSTDVETLETEGDADIVPADVQGGPVEEPKIPAAKKAPAKKAPAKKAPAKKAAAKKADTAEPVAEAVNEETGEITAADEPLPETPVDDDVSAEVALMEQELGATVVAEETKTPAPEPAPDETPVVTQQPKDKPAPAKTGAKACGDQPPSMVGKFDAREGCGTTLSADNAGRAQLSMLKFKTYLCDDCFEKAKAA